MGGSTSAGAAELNAVRASAAGRLRASGVASPEADVECLLAHVLGVRRAQLAAQSALSAAQMARFGELVDRRCRREPLQHLTGIAGFRHLDIRVGPGVFVPRPETEILAGLAIAAAEAAKTAGRDRPVVVDLCAGSAAVALAIATEVREVDAWAVEFEPAALRWAQENVTGQRDLLASRGSTVNLVLADVMMPETVGLIAGLAGSADVVVSNPPYIPDAAVPRDPEVAEHDPGAALFGGPDGLDIVRAMLPLAAALLRPGGRLFIEHGDEQGEDGRDASVPALVRADGRFDAVADHLDLAGRPRVTEALRCD